MDWAKRHHSSMYGDSGSVIVITDWHWDYATLSKTRRLIGDVNECRVVDFPWFTAGIGESDARYLPFASGDGKRHDGSAGHGVFAQLSRHPQASMVKDISIVVANKNY